MVFVDLVKVRGMKKRNEAAAEEAKLALEDYESLSKQLEGSSRGENPKVGPSSGRMVFNAAGKQQAPRSSKTKSDDRTKADGLYDASDSENDLQTEDNNEDGDIVRNDSQQDINIDPSLLHEVLNGHQDGLFKVISFMVFQLLNFMTVLFVFISIKYGLFVVHRALMILLKTQVRKRHMKFLFLPQAHGKRYKCETA